MRILVLDDEDGARRLLFRAIRKCEPDAEIYSFSDVEEALACARMHDIDVAFLDIQMPWITGLEVAKRLKGIKANVNIIFCTGYSEYAVEAITLRASGYLLKPVNREEVARELNALRFPIEEEESSRQVRARTFGNFDLFRNGKPIAFHRERAKEMLAYLIDRRGASVTRKELAAVLFEDEEYSRSTQAYLTQIVKSLRETLEENELSHLLLVSYNAYAIDVSEISCDAYDYLAGKPGALNAFHGEYMAQYSWGEYQSNIFFTK